MTVVLVEDAPPADWLSSVVAECAMDPHQALRASTRSPTVESLVAREGGRRVGILRFCTGTKCAEVVLVVARARRRGIGRRLLVEMMQICAARGVARVWMRVPRSHRSVCALARAVGMYPVLRTPPMLPDTEMPPANLDAVEFEHYLPTALPRIRETCVR